MVVVFFPRLGSEFRVGIERVSPLAKRLAAPSAKAPLRWEWQKHRVVCPEVHRAGSRLRRVDCDFPNPYPVRLSVLASRSRSLLRSQWAMPIA